MVIRELLVRLGIIADTKKVKEFDDAVDDLKGKLGEVVTVAAKVVTGIAAVGAAGAAMALSTAKAAEAIERQAVALGISVEAAQEYAAVFNRFNLEAKDVPDVFNTLADRARDAQDGMQSFIDDFALLGLTVEDLRRRSPEELFYTLARGVEQTTDVTTRNAAVVRILGDDIGNELIPLLVQGADAITLMREEARRLGQVMSEEDVKAGKEAAQVFRSFGFVLQGLRNQIGLAVIPTLTRLVVRVQDFVARFRELARDKVEQILERFGEAAEEAERRLVSVDRFVKDNLSGWGNVLRRVQTALVVFAGAKAWGIITAAVGAVQAGLAAVAAAAGVSLGSAALIVAAAAVAVVALGLAIDDLMTYLRGGESVLGRFLEGTEEGRMLVEAFGLAAGQAGLIIDQLAPVFEFLAMRMDLLALAGEVLGKVLFEILAFGFQAVVRQVTAFISFIAHAYELLNSIIALIKGEGGVGDVFKEAMESIAAGVLALPGIGALTGGAPTTFIGNSRPAAPPTFAPARTPVGGGNSSAPSVTNVTIQGNTTNLNSEVTPSQLKEMARVGDLERGRQLRAYADI